MPGRTAGILPTVPLASLQAVMIPLWLKLAFSLMTAGVLIAYWFRYGPINYLWFSNIALIGTAAALWLENPLLASALAVLVLLPQAAWILILITRLTTGWTMAGLLDYMFDPNRPLWLRLLSLYHLPLPTVLLGLVWVLGYDDRALPLAVAIAWIVLPLSWLLAPAERNINWVHAMGREGRRNQARASGRKLLILMVAVPLLIHLPTHLLLRLSLPAAG